MVAAIAKTVYLKCPISPNTTKYSHRMDIHWFVVISVVGDDTFSDKTEILYFLLATITSPNHVTEADNSRRPFPSHPSNKRKGFLNI